MRRNVRLRAGAGARSGTGGCVRVQGQKRAPPGESPCLQERVHGKKTRGTGLLPPGVKDDGPGNFTKILPGEGKKGDIESGRLGSKRGWLGPLSLSFGRKFGKKGMTARHL